MKCIVCGVDGGKLVKGKCKRCYNREYTRRPEVKAKAKKYLKRPKIKAKRNEYLRGYNKRPGVKAKAKEYYKEYHKRPEVKAVMSSRRGYRNQINRLKQKIEKLKAKKENISRLELDTLWYYVLELKELEVDNQ